jgi:segregation and condensation protein A
VSVREQAALIGGRLRRERALSFRALVADADTTLIIVARFLALLELFRDGAVIFEQVEALGELTIRWTGPEEGDIEVDGEFDEEGVRNASGTDDQPPGPATATTTTEEQDG